MAGPKANANRRSAARLLPMSTPDAEVASTLAAMITDVIGQADGKAQWKDLRVTVLPSTADPSFHQLRVGVHVG